MGRKKTMKTDTKIDVRLRMDEELHQRIQAAAETEGNSIAAFIRATVVKELNRRDRERV
jgi:predicted HicB family RNase H-like nuclease